MKRIFSRIFASQKKLSPAELAASLVELTIVLALIVVVSLTAARLMWSAMDRNMKISTANSALTLLSTLDDPPELVDVSPGFIRNIKSKNELAAAEGPLASLVSKMQLLTFYKGNNLLPVAAGAICRIQEVDVNGDPICRFEPPIPLPPVGPFDNIACRIITEDGDERECTNEEILRLIECLLEVGFLDECSDELDCVIPVTVWGQCGIAGSDDGGVILIGTRTVPGGGT